MNTTQTQVTPSQGEQVTNKANKANKASKAPKLTPPKKQGLNKGKVIEMGVKGETLKAKSARIRLNNLWKEELSLSKVVDFCNKAGKGLFIEAMKEKGLTFPPAFSLKVGHVLEAGKIAYKVRVKRAKAGEIKEAKNWLGSKAQFSASFVVGEIYTACIQGGANLQSLDALCRANKGGK
jgi:hypothetical protein